MLLDRYVALNSIKSLAKESLKLLLQVEMEVGEESADDLDFTQHDVRKNSATKILTTLKVY